MDKVELLQLYNLAKLNKLSEVQRVVYDYLIGEYIEYRKVCKVKEIENLLFTITYKKGV